MLLKIVWPVGLKGVGHHGQVLRADDSVGVNCLTSDGPPWLRCSFSSGHRSDGESWIYKESIAHWITMDISNAASTPSNASTVFSTYSAGRSWSTIRF